MLENVAVDDLLPGGFEIVEESVRTGACSGWGEFEYTDVREDRLLAFGTVTGGDTEITYRHQGDESRHVCDSAGAGGGDVPPEDSRAWGFGDADGGLRD